MARHASPKRSGLSPLLTFITGILLMALAFFLLLSERERVPTPPPPEAPTATHQAYWEREISRVGGTRAYAEFARYVSPLDMNAEHNLAHAFGGALYRVSGLPGITACDARFTYGCYHEFVGEAIRDKGESVILTINSYCSTTLFSAGCKHGIGHGLVGYLGYGAKDLRKATAACATIDNGDSLQGCYGGAFMEYNMRTLAGSSARKAEDGFGAPCKAYTGHAGESCYLYQPQWWLTVLPQGAYQRTFKEMGTLCPKESAPRAACFEGIGLLAPAQRGVSDPYTLCEASAKDQHDLGSCATGMVVAMTGTGSSALTAKEVCSKLPEGVRQPCLTYATQGVQL